MNARLLAVTAVGIIGLFSSNAHADGPTKEQCASANESAQTLRHDGKLQASRAQLRVCVSKGCPQVIRDDCAERLTDVEAAMPTIVLAAKGANNADLVNVKVTMDEAPLTERLDGSALEVDPGTHNFELTSAGYAPASVSLVIREGVKRRQEMVKFTPLESAATGPTPKPGEPKSEPPHGEEGDTGSGRRTLAYGLAGLGVVGIVVGTYFGLKASSTYDKAFKTCDKGDPNNCSDEGERQSKDAHSQATISTIGFIAGGALLAGGVVLYLTAPKSGGVSVGPTASTTGAGLRVGGVF